MGLPAISPLRSAENIFHQITRLITIHFCTAAFYDDFLIFKPQIRSSGLIKTALEQGFPGGVHGTEPCLIQET